MAAYPTHARLTRWLGLATSVVLLTACGSDAAGPSTVEDPPSATGQQPDEDASTGAEDEPEEPAPDDGLDAEPDSEPTEVALRDDDAFVFDPAENSVATGGTVRWSHEGRISHTVTATDGSFASGTLAAGETFEVTFDEPGSYPYVCDFHGSMRGTIEVS